MLHLFCSFDPQALTSLTPFHSNMLIARFVFRSTGSYEPDLRKYNIKLNKKGFDPQALTSLTTTGLIMESVNILFRSTGSYEPDQQSSNVYSADDCFDPQALTSLTGVFNFNFPMFDVSIHRLLRA